MKAAEGSSDKVAQYIKRLGMDYSVLSGDDALTLPFMSSGAKGVISVASEFDRQSSSRNGQCSKQQ